MNGNVTLEGVRADLEWMQRVGIGGVQNLDASADAQQFVRQPVDYLTPRWREAFAYSVDLANRMGLDFDIESTPGWSVSGGPWVKPQQAMKKLVWSETVIEGGALFKGRLAAPPRITGPFQNLPLTDWSGKVFEGLPVHYADVAVIAYRASAAESGETLTPAVTSSAGALDATRLHDGDLRESLSLPFNEQGPAWIQFSFSRPQRIQAISAVIGKVLSNVGVWEMEAREAAWLEASAEGEAFRRIVELPRAGTAQQTVSFSPVTARVFRVMLERPPAPVLSGAAIPTAHQIAELVLHCGARINRFEDKAGFATRAIASNDDTREVDAVDAIRQKDMIDLTSRVRPNGTLDWTPPKGRWIVLRFGYSLIGKTNHPASPAGTGLEVDKLNRAHVSAYMESYLRPYEEILGAGPSAQPRLRSMHLGSYEAGPQNWTDDMLDQFKRRRGYDARRWLPALAGRIVESASSSDRFLWDFRQTLGDLIIEGHYQTIAAELRKRGMQSYFESQAERRAFHADGMRMKQAADIPMGEMWTERIRCCELYTQEVYDADVQEAASVAHLYSKPLIAAESFTSASFPLGGADPYSASPATLKPTADRILAMGANRFVLHASVHQPLDKPGPGITLGFWGQWLTRKETWAPQAGAWVDYLTRSSYLLQQGRFVADIAYLYGEGNNLADLFHASRPPIPKGYNFDFINAEALLNELSVREGLLVARSGMTYRLLALDPSTARMSLRALRKIRDLAAAGALVVGAPPLNSPSLADDADAGQFQRIVDEVWRHGALRSNRVITDIELANAMHRLGIAPDFTYTGPQQDTELLFTHRALNDGEIYFVNSRNNYPQTVEASFRVTGRIPELWRADTGAITALSYRIEDDRTVVPLKLDPHDAVFVVFRRPTTVLSADIREPRVEKLLVLEGPWDIGFPPHLGAPAHTRFPKLRSWSESTDPGVKYFSGTATYTKTFRISPAWLKEGARLQLDLGTVREVVEVRVNGRPMGVLWKAPFTLDITQGVKAGDNCLEIQVSNLWRNRLIGDKQPGATPVAFATHDPFKADSALLPSGLLGPVSLLKTTAR